jgi:hypothetical protein
MLENEMRGIGRSILKSTFHDLFGAAALSSLSDKKAKFLGMATLKEIEPHQDFDI